MNSSLKLSEAKEIYTHSRRRARRDRLCWSLPSYRSSNSWQFLADRQAWLPAHKFSTQLKKRGDSQTRPARQRSQTPGPASFNKGIKCRFLFFFHKCLLVVEWECVFTGRALWLSSFVVPNKEPRCAALCFTAVILPLQRRHGAQGTAWKIHIALNSAVGA